MRWRMVILSGPMRMSWTRTCRTRWRSSVVAVAALSRSRARKPSRLSASFEVGVAVGGLGVEGGDLVLQAGFAGAQVRHAGAELVDGQELLGERGDHRGDRCGGLGEGLLELAALAGDRGQWARLLEPPADLGADECGVGEQGRDVVPDDLVDVAGADGLAAADAAALVAVVVGAEAPVVIDLVPGGGRGGGAVVAVAAGRAGGQALQQGRDLGIAGGEPLVVGQPLLDPVRTSPRPPGRERGCASIPPPAGPAAGMCGWRAGRCGSARPARGWPASCRTPRGRRRRGCGACPRSPTGPTVPCRCGCAPAGPSSSGAGRRWRRRRRRSGGTSPRPGQPRAGRPRSGPRFPGSCGVPVAERGTGQHVDAAGLRPQALPRRYRSASWAFSYSANMPWNWTSSWSSGLSPRGPFTNSTRAPHRASSSISSAW